LSIEDDGFSGGKGVSAYQKLVNVDKIDGLINVSTPTIDSIYETVTKAGLPVIQGGEQGRVPADDNVFGIYPDSIASERDYGVYMKNKGISHMNLVYTNIDAMIRFVAAFKEGFQGSTTDFMIDASEKDFRTHALKVTASNADAIGLFIFPQQGAQFMKEYLKLAKKKTPIFFDTNFVSGSTDYQRIMGDLTVLDGATVGAMKLDTADSFKTAYKTRFGADPGFLADIGYDAFNLLVQSHDSDNTKWISNIKKVTFPGVSGRISFSITGNRTPETLIKTIQAGKLIDLK
jgi:ABC-type branched-subunit amino acid transport system substrate-binding protein